MNEPIVEVGANYLAALEETVRAYRKQVDDLVKLYALLDHDSRCQLQLELGDCDCWRKPVREILVQLCCLADGGAK